jgi:hypothetical protein
MPNPPPICPVCHQPIRELRVGVRLPPIKARLFDLIKAAGSIGVSAQELHSDLYRGYGRPRSKHNIRNHIWQINDILEESNWIIVADGRGQYARWYLQRRKIAA